MESSVKVSSMSNSMFVQACGNIAPIASIVVTLAPIPTINEIAKKQSTMNLPLLPYTSMFVNAFIWTTYGVLTNEIRIWSCNVVSIFCGLYYIRKYLAYVPPGASNLPGNVTAHFQLGSAIIIGTILVVLSCRKEFAKDLVGNAGVILCLVLFGSPLSTLKQVMKTRSAISIPLPFTISCCINCFCWSVFGIFGVNDAKVYFPNVIGFVFAITQLSLICLFGSMGHKSEGLEVV
mmetsp:Transcript_8655/g.11122  ORF Transcript_8655/g.11122 Transcript_8655/m.11122 type:complete len:234 (+) Transcript_8655:255-956(+)